MRQGSFSPVNERTTPANFGSDARGAQVVQVGAEDQSIVCQSEQIRCEVDAIHEHSLQVDPRQQLGANGFGVTAPWNGTGFFERAGTPVISLRQDHFDRLETGSHPVPFIKSDAARIEKVPAMDDVGEDSLGSQPLPQDERKSVPGPACGRIVRSVPAATGVRHVWALCEHDDRS
uniref:hypothetical protein n=1 Tax=Rhodococcus hoagii TaxID=43767 RepID=UPI00155DC49C|nr:hypothetical protein [Prescottella equi]